MTFKEQYLAGKVEIEQLDSFVAQWHSGRKPGEFITCFDTINGVLLLDFLGLTKEEFDLLLRDYSLLKAKLDLSKIK